MSEITFIALFTAMFAVSLLLHWLDNKYNLQLSKWLGGCCDSPFKTTTKPKSQKDSLTQRVEALETIVTEPAYELNRKLNQL